MTIFRQLSSSRQQYSACASATTSQQEIGARAAGGGAAAAFPGSDEAALRPKRSRLADIAVEKAQAYRTQIELASWTLEAAEKTNERAVKGAGAQVGH